MMSTSMRKTKIIITLGKASSSVEALVSLINAGIDAVRITTRFLNAEERTRVLENLRIAEKLTQKFVCVILSLREGDIRIGNANAGKRLNLKPGDILKIVTNKALCVDENTIVCNTSSFPNMVKPGDKLLVEFGKAIFTVDHIEEQIVPPEALPTGRSSDSSNEIRERYKRVRPKSQKFPKIVHCKAENECTLSDENPLNFMNASSLDPNKCNSELEDIRLLEWAGPMDIDIIIYKQVRDEEDLEALYNFVTPPNTKRFVGIQTRETAENPDWYLDLSEGCSIGRGILGVETSHSRVCSLQKEIVRLSNAKGKPVFISTQVLESMVINDKPSRAEVVDSYCAVTDGADALMLTGETAYGKYPELAVKALNRICVEAEQYIDYKTQREEIYNKYPKPIGVAMGICYFAADAVEKIGASLIICLTKSGKTAKWITMFKPSCIVMAITNSLKTLKYLRIVRGIYPVLVENTNSIENIAIDTAINDKLIMPGQICIFVGDKNDKLSEGGTSSLRIVTANRINA